MSNATNLRSRLRHLSTLLARHATSTPLAGQDLFRVTDRDAPRQYAELAALRDRQSDRGAEPAQDSAAPRSVCAPLTGRPARRASA